jgi:hypothetical protein
VTTGNRQKQRSALSYTCYIILQLYCIAYKENKVLLLLSVHVSQALVATSPDFTLVSCSAISSTLGMEATGSSKMLVDFQQIRLHGVISHKIKLFIN